MRYRLLATAIAVVLPGLAAAAQTPTPPPAPSTPRAPATIQPAGPTEKAQTTVVGCLKTWEPASSPTGIAKPPGEPADRDAGALTQYVLMNLEGESSSAKTGGTTPAAKTYLLKPEATVNLAAHLNHKVQLTGSVTPASTRPPIPPPAGSQETAELMSRVAPTLRVTSLKMVSATCP